MSTQTEPSLESFQWRPQPYAAALAGELLSQFIESMPDIPRFARRLRDETATRLIDWIDHLALPADDRLHTRLEEANFVPRQREAWLEWNHADGLFPQIITHDESTRRIAIRIESVADFVAAQGLDRNTQIEGGEFAPLRRALISVTGRCEFWAVERHGDRGWNIEESTIDSAAVRQHAEQFSKRRRNFEDSSAGFDEARSLIAAAVADLGIGRAADLFFAAERNYWTGRNRAAKFQKRRQDALGLGWANHDHHTYRSSRQHFAQLIAFLEVLGFHCRERFYAGREAGWGAQVLEQEESQVVIFADVDLSPDEVTEDFAHAPLAPRDHYGTVGLWCLLHGEAFLEAGMHHLECRFDFAAAKEQFERAGITVMQPFTDLSYLKQAFTAAELWKVDSHRAESAIARGSITREQAERFCRDGALGSHLEILQRDDGYKGFNQSGINEIIRATDPRSINLPSQR